MYKKIGISLLAIILMFNFTLKDYADAAIATKAAGQAAKQVAKEVIQDIAVETAANFALQQAMDIVNGYEADQGYKVICPDGGKTCDNPVQIKQNLSEVDKIQIKSQSGNELDNLLNGGAGVSRWQKFLDWFLPVWLISFGATALTYAFDSDVRSLFNEAAYNTLVTLGIIKPVSGITPIAEAEPNVTDPEKGYHDGYIPATPEKTVFSFSENMSTGYVSSGSTINMFDNWRRLENIMYSVNFTYSSPQDRISYRIHSSNNYDNTLGGISNNFLYVGTPTFGNAVNTVVNVDGRTVFDGVPNSSGGYYLSSGQIENINQKQIKSILWRAPYVVGGFAYTDMLFNTVDGNIINVQTKYSNPSSPSFYNFGYSIFGDNQNKVGINSTVYTQVQPSKTRLISNLPVLEKESGQVMQKSNYEDDTGKVALIPPSALTYKEDGTGETVYRVPAAVPTNPPVFQKENGTPVPEENVTVDPAPTVKPAPNGSTTEKGEPIPEGTPTVTPAPTPSNPAPAPIPLTPAPTPTPTTPTPEPTTPVEPPTTGDPPTNGEPIPDGPSCEEKFKFPILSPLKETFSTSFPFSIPWDIERAINAAFSGIGHEKPKFDLDLNVLGQKETIEITTPKMFDDWKPFTDTLLVLTFDVLIMFGVYRFVKGAGS